MNRCCIPFCKSVRGRKDKTGFFEFPYKVKQRILWQNAIVQACLDNDIDVDFCKFAERSIVCEKHFTKKDFSISTTRKRILPNAIPSIFYNRSTVKQATFSCEHEPDIELIREIPLNLSKEIEETSLTQVTTSVERSFNQNTKYHTQEVKKQAICLRKPTIIKLDKTVSIISEHNNPFECNSSRENLEFYKNHSKKEPRWKDKALAVQLQNRLKVLKKQNTNLRCRIKQSMKKYTSLTSNEKTLSLEDEQFNRIVNEKAENNLPSTLLFEQIKKFGKKKIILSDTALELYFLGQKQFPGGYDFVRKKKLCSLPHRNTLTKYIEFSPDEEVDQSSDFR